MSNSSIVVCSFAKINLGLKIGRLRPDGFHELGTVYQTIALHDVVHVDVQPGSEIEIRCNNSRVPLDASNTCYKVAERVLAAELQGLKPCPDAARSGTAEAVPFQSAASDGTAKTVPLRGKVVIQIDKRLPVQGGLGAASSNAVATMFGLERALGIKLTAEDELRIAAEVGSDLPLFLVGGTVLGAGRGEQVYPLPDLPTTHLVVVTPPVGVSTPAAFARWDEMAARQAELTGANPAGTINKLGQGTFDWPNDFFSQAVSASGPASGVPAMGGDRAETLLLDLVRTGIENDFERVVFPEYPELREVKRALESEGARYASLSGSGSALYGLFASGEEAQSAAARMTATGHVAVATTTLTRTEYWQQMFV
jgi:4-diphosphocytidyl-2-C-methyl-D-erythritol kinase